MSRMSEIAIDIMELFEEGYTADRIAYRLGIPTEMVLDCIISGMVVQDTEDCPVA